MLLLLDVCLRWTQQARLCTQDVLPGQTWRSGKVKTGLISLGQVLFAVPGVGLGVREVSAVYNPSRLIRLGQSTRCVDLSEPGVWIWQSS